MSASTTRLGLTKPGGGSTGLITPADIVDIDVLNANFDKIDASMGYTIATSGARPSTPFNGQPIFETDTRNEMYWSTAAGRWIPLGIPNAASLALRNGLYPTPVGGERVYRTDVRQTEFYTGTKWRFEDGRVGPDTVTQTGTSTAIQPDGSVVFTGCTSVSLNGLFPTDANEVEIDIVIDSSVGNNFGNFVLRAAGADITSANYDQQKLQGQNVTATVSPSAAQANWQWALAGGTQHHLVFRMRHLNDTSAPEGIELVFDLNNPMSTPNFGTIGIQGLLFRLGTAVDGFTFTMAAAGTGRITTKILS